MARIKSNETASRDATANLGFEAKLWLTADRLRNNANTAEYKHAVLGLIFLKYISDLFEKRRAKLVTGQGDYENANSEGPVEYKAENVFWVPKEARRSYLQGATIGKLADDAIVAIERDNPCLKGVLPKDYARPRPRQTALRRVDQSHRRQRWRKGRSVRRGARPTKAAPTIPPAASAAFYFTRQALRPGPNERELLKITDLCRRTNASA